MKKEIKALKILKKFNDFKILSKNSNHDEVIITKPSLSRAGLALFGWSNVSTSNSIITWGTKEAKFFDSLTNDELKKKLNYIASLNHPMILLSVNFDKKYVPVILSIFKKTIIVDTMWHVREIFDSLGSWLTEAFADEKIVHGCLVIVNGLGILISGESGIGKSEAVLELLKSGHIFVADDSVVITRVGRKFFGKPAKITKGFLETRGLGIIDVYKTYGQRAIRDWARIDLVIELKSGLNVEQDRTSRQLLQYKIHDSHLPKIILPVLSGRPIGVMVEITVDVFTNYKTNVDNSLNTIKERISQ